MHQYLIHICVCQLSYILFFLPSDQKIPGSVFFSLVVVLRFELLGKQAVYHLSHASSPFTLVIFQIVSHTLCPGQPHIMILQPAPPHS
jgi:hypothetical protein